MRGQAVSVRRAQPGKAGPLRLGLLTVFGLLSAAPFYWASHAHAGKAIGAAVLTAAAACAAGGVVASWRGNLRRAVVALMTVVLIVTVVGRPLATDFYLRPPAVLNAIAQVSQTIPPGAPLAEHGVRYELLYLKMNRPVAFLDDEAAMQAFLQKDGERYLIAREEDVPAIEHLAGRPLKVIGKWPLGGKGEIPTAVLATSP
jgi:hypothetical protein